MKHLTALVLLILLMLLPTLATAEDGAFITFDPPGSTSTLPSAITPTGAILGSYTDADGVTHGFLRDPGGSFATIDPPGSLYTVPTAITPIGAITGVYADTAGTHGFLRTHNGTFITFDAPPGGVLFPSIYIPGGPPPTINPAETIVGTYSVFAPSFAEHGFLRGRDGTLITIDVPNAEFTEVLAINPAGTIVGDYCDASTCFSGFLLTREGTFIRIDIPGCAPAEQESIPSGINPAGTVVGSGSCTSLGGNTSGYVRTPDGTVTLFDPPGSTYTSPFAVNPAGVITGYFFSDTFHGFLRAPDGAITTIDVPGSVGTVALAIAPTGSITGEYFDSGFVSHGFLWTP